LVARVPLTSLAEGELVRIKYPPFDVLVTLCDGVPYAIEDACNHAGASLAEGFLRGGDRIVCPMHGYVFTMKSGELLAPRGLCDRQRTFEAKIEGDEVVIRDAFELALVTSLSK
jgi:nitrite reductase/ring-hydroxylating ferredoxin subunit